MDKRIRNYHISIVVFGLEALAYFLAGPENPGWRVGLTVVLLATVPFIFVNAWKSAPARRALRKDTADASATE